MFDVKELIGRQVTWQSVREALAILRKPASLKEIEDTVWRVLQIYSQRIGCGALERSDSYPRLLANMVHKQQGLGRLKTALVGPQGDQTEFFWLLEEEWPDQREREIMANFRTVNQAVRC